MQPKDTIFVQPAWVRLPAKTCWTIFPAHPIQHYFCADLSVPVKPPSPSLPNPIQHYFCADLSVPTKPFPVDSPRSLPRSETIAHHQSKVGRHCPHHVYCSVATWIWQNLPRRSTLRSGSQIDRFCNDDLSISLRLLNMLQHPCRNLTFIYALLSGFAPFTDVLFSIRTASNEMSRLFHWKP